MDSGPCCVWAAGRVNYFTTAPQDENAVTALIVVRLLICVAIERCIINAECADEVSRYDFTSIQSHVSIATYARG